MPAKVSDPRAKDYIAKYGDKSWEVDALPPDVLTKIIRKALESVTDMERMAAIKDKERRDKKQLLAAVEKIMAGGDEGA